jgi:serine/threonine protein kinase
MESIGKKITRVLLDDRTYNVEGVRNGGMGRVWLLTQAFPESRDPVYRHELAVKTFDFVSDQQTIECELNAWISLQHQFVLPLLKLGRLNYQLAAIMPRMHGSLDNLLEEGRTFSEQETSLTMFEIALALEHAWKSAGILHLDIKPSNVLVEDSHALRIKVSDWGISRLVGQKVPAAPIVAPQAVDPKSKVTAYSAGTPLFMSPERFSRSWQMSPAVDIYSLGLMAVLLNTGTLPFRFGQVDPLEEIVTGALYVNARALLADRTSRFQKLCLGSLDPNPVTRISSYHTFLRQAASLTRG